MQRTEFSTAGRIILGAGVSTELPALLSGIGRRAALVISAGAVARGGSIAQLAARLRATGGIAVEIAVRGEPEVTAVEAATAEARAAGCDCVVALGGGSVIDSGKAIAALAANPGQALDYLETVGGGQPLDHAALPIVAVPTTAGAGSEATRNAVVRSQSHRAKASIRDATLLPRLALVDAALTLGLPRSVTAACGMDALTQLIEAFVSRRAGPLTDGLCREGIVLAVRGLTRAYADPEDLIAREALSAAALLSGMALANAGLGAVHGIAAPLGGAFRAPHGAVCAALLAPITAANLRALRRGDEGKPALARYAEIARLMDVAGGAEALPDALAALAGDLAIPGLGTYGVGAADLPALAEQAHKASSTRSNPATLSQAELAEAIGAAL